MNRPLISNSKLRPNRNNDNLQQHARPALLSLPIHNFQLNYNYAIPRASLLPTTVNYNINNVVLGPRPLLETPHIRPNDFMPLMDPARMTSYNNNSMGFSQLATATSPANLQFSHLSYGQDFVGFNENHNIAPIINSIPNYPPENAQIDLSRLCLPNNNNVSQQQQRRDFWLHEEQPKPHLQQEETPRVNLGFEHNINTIILENEDDIQMVSMVDDYDAGSEAGSPYDPNLDVSLLDIDYNLNKGKDIEELNAITNEISKEVENSNSIVNGHDKSIEEAEYWKKTRDCDYRFLPSNFTDDVIDANLKLHRQQSGKKCKKQKRKRKNKSKNKTLDVSDSPFNNSANVNVNLDLDKVDEMPYEDLISVYNKLKEELTLLNVDNDVESAKEGSAEKPIELDTVSIEAVSDDDCQLVEEIKIIKTELEKDEAKKLNEVLEKDVLIEENTTTTTTPTPATVAETSNTVDSVNDDLALPLNSALSCELGAHFDNEALNENLLREQLIRNMLEKRMAKLTTTTTSPPPLSSSSLAPSSPTSTKPSPSLIATRSVLDLSTKNNKEILDLASKPVEPVKPKIDLSRYHLVIQLSDGEDSQEEEEGEEGGQVKNLDTSATTVKQVVMNKRSRLPQGDVVKTGRLSHSNGFIHKLSQSQQEEYRKLKKEIERRELSVVSSAGLQKCESKLKESIQMRKQRSQRIGVLKRNMLITRKELKKSQSQVRHLQKLLIAANKKVSLYTVKLQLGSKELTEAQNALKNDAKVVRECKEMCLNIGQKLHGPSYTLPSITTNNNDNSESSQQLKQRIKSFKEIKDNLAKGTNKETEVSLKFLRGKIKSLLKSNHTYETVLLFEHYVNFNFALFQSSTFYQTRKSDIEFNEFSEKRSDVLNDDVDSFPQLNPHHLTVENYNSVLQHFNSYRFASHQNFDISSDHWSNALNPNQFICIYDLFGVCHDINCKFQHQKDYIYEPQAKVIDVLTYLPQLEESLNLGQYRNDPKALRSVLSNYVQSKLAQSDQESIENLCRNISNQIKNQSKTSVSSFFIRSIPKELVNFCDNVPNSSVQVPFDDYLYRFDLKDESFHMKLSQLCNLRVTNDPDFYLKNRFFAPEGIPISAQLEASLATDPHNVPMWIKLAYCYLKRFRNGEQDINFCLDSSLNVLSRALELNQTNAELYEQYLLFYSNKLDLLEADDSLSTENIVPIDQVCHRILQFCSTYRLWICYLNLGDKLSHKEHVVQCIMKQFCNGHIQFENDEERSLNVLEIIMYRINLYLQLNKHEDAVKLFNQIFSDNPSKTNDSLCLAQLNTLITKQHRVFAWLCYIHIALYRCLPYHCFQLCKKSSFLNLIHTRPFVFNWKSITSESDLVLIEKILNRAIKNCCCLATEAAGENSFNCHQSECNNSCFALRFNLAQLGKLIQSHRQSGGGGGGDVDAASSSKELTNSYSYLSTVYSDNFQALSHLHILQLFEIDLKNVNQRDESIVLNLIENFYNSYNHTKLCESIQIDDHLVIALRHQLQFNYWLAFYHHKYGNVAKCKQILIRSLSYYYCDTIIHCDDLFRDDCVVQQLFELILFDDFSFDENVPFTLQETIRNGLKFGRYDRRTLKLVYLYLSYLMFLHINWRKSELNLDQHYLKLDCVFSSVVNSFTSCNQANNDDYKFLWLNYFLILLEFPFSDSHFKSVYETLRLICVTFNSTDPIFIYHLTNALSELIVPQDRLYFLIEISKLNPDNANLIIKVINLALQLSKKETCWNFITHIVYQKKIRLQCFEFWKIAISLSIERNDHLNTHKFFQMAISLMPYNVQLWEMLKNYETSVNHTDHLHQIRHFYQHTLDMLAYKLFDK